MRANDSFCKTEESLLKNHPLYENRGDDVIYRLMKEIEELKQTTAEVESKS